MDQKQLQEKIAEYYSKLPPNAQEKFASMAWMQTLQDIAKTYNLTPDQIEVLATETTLALLGILHPDEYREILLKSMAVSKETEDKILEDIYEKIFKDISPDLMQAYAQNIEDVINEDMSDVPLPANLQEDDDIPLPPAPKVVTPTIVNKPKLENPQSQALIFKDAGIEVVGTPNIIEEKLMTKVASNASVKDYTLPKMSTMRPSDGTKKQDPYHEAV